MWLFFWVNIILILYYFKSRPPRRQPSRGLYKLQPKNAPPPHGLNLDWKKIINFGVKAVRFRHYASNLLILQRDLLKNDYTIIYSAAGGRSCCACGQADQSEDSVISDRSVQPFVICRLYRKNKKEFPLHGDLRNHPIWAQSRTRGVLSKLPFEKCGWNGGKNRARGAEIMEEADHSRSMQDNFQLWAWKEWSRSQGEGCVYQGFLSLITLL